MTSNMREGLLRQRGVRSLGNIAFDLGSSALAQGVPVSSVSDYDTLHAKVLGRTFIGTKRYN